MKKIHIAKRTKNGTDFTITECDKTIYSHRTMPIITTDEMFKNADESRCCSHCLIIAKQLGIK